MGEMQAIGAEERVADFAPPGVCYVLPHVRIVSGVLDERTFLRHMAQSIGDERTLLKVDLANGPSSCAWLCRWTMRGPFSGLTSQWGCLVTTDVSQVELRKWTFLLRMAEPIDE